MNDEQEQKLMALDPDDHDSFSIGSPAKPISDRYVCSESKEADPIFVSAGFGFVIGFLFRDRIQGFLERLSGGR